jgi:chaperone BCS1
VSLSGLLNALDGVGAQEGRILFATTNKYESLDPALSRPGRMDIHVEFKLASKYQAAELYRCFYLPEEDDNGDADDDDEGKERVDSGCDSMDNVDPREVLSEVSDPLSPISHPVSPSPSERSTVRVRTHRARAPKLSHSKVTSLANRFSDGIPEREFSMASLQGYLMAYKTMPFDAVKDVSGWVAKNRPHRTSFVDSDT